MLAPAQRATPGKGLRLASQTLIPGHVRREPDVGHPTPEARLLPTYANLRAAANSHQRRKKNFSLPQVSGFGPRLSWERERRVVGGVRRAAVACAGLALIAQ